MATLGSLRTDLQTLAGTDLTNTEANQLLNEAHDELCVRSEWTRANLELGPLVDGQAAYALTSTPANVERILKVKINGHPLVPADEETVDRIITGDGIRLGTGVSGVHWLSFDSSGVEKLSIYPTPGAADVGLSLVANAVIYPTPLSADADVPVVPRRFHAAIRDKAAALFYGYDEDNVQLRAYYDERFNEAVGILHALRVSRNGHGNAHLRIEGVNA